MNASDEEPGARAHVGWRSSSRDRLTPKHWVTARVIQVWIFVLWGMVLGSVILGALGSSGKAGTHTVAPWITVVVGGISLHGAGWLAILFFLRSHQRTWSEAFGSVLTQVWIRLREGLLSALVIVPVAYGLLWLVNASLNRLGIELPPQVQVQWMMKNEGWRLPMALAFTAVILAPIVEEALFRGITLVAIRDTGRVRLARMATSLLFGVVHGNIAAMLPLAAFGYWQARVYERTGNLQTCIVTHAIFNCVPFIAMGLGLDS